MYTDTKLLCIVFGLCSLTILQQTTAQKGLTPVYQWGNLEYDYPSDDARQAAIDAKQFIPENGAPIDTDVYYTRRKTKIFVTIPRFQNGIPVTLGTLTNRSTNGNPVIAPYPAWSWHQNSESCPQDRLISVFRVKIDECQRLWVLDTGRIGETRICHAQIIAFDLKSNQVIHRYEIPDSQLYSNSILTTPIVDVRDAHALCVDTFVYIADCQAMALIVHDVQKGTSWRIIDKTMYPSPFFGTYTVAGHSFELMDGILGMDLSPYEPGKDRILYFHAMSSGTEQWVYTSFLRNATLFLDNTTPAPEIFHVYSGSRHTQAPAMAVDKNGIAYFGLISDITMNCWNTAVEYGQNNIDVIAQNRVTLQFPTGVKVITNGYGKQELWLVTSRFQRMATGTLDVTDTNFRIMAGKIDDLTKGSKCLSKPIGDNHYLPSYGGGEDGDGGGGYGFARKRRTNRVHFPYH